MNFKEHLIENDMFSGMLNATKTYHFLSPIRWPSFKKKLEKLATTPEQEKDIKFFEKCYQLSRIKTPEDVKSFKIKSVEDLSIDVRKDYIEFEVEINGIPIVGQFNEYNTKEATIEFLKGWRDPDTLRAIKSNSFPYPAYYASKEVLSKDERADLDKIETNLIKSFSNNETYFKESQGKQQYLKEDTLVSQEELVNYYRYTVGSSSTTEDREAISDDTLTLIYKFLKQNIPNRYKVFIAYKKTHPQRQHIYGEKRYFILVDYNYVNPKKLPINFPLPRFLEDLLKYLKPIIANNEWDELRHNLITLENLKSYSKMENNPNYYVWEPYNLNEPSKEMFGGMLKSL